MLNLVRFSARSGLRSVRCNSTATSGAPPLLAKLRSDLKDAMKAKDTARYGLYPANALVLAEGSAPWSVATAYKAR